MTLSVAIYREQCIIGSLGASSCEMWWRAVLAWLVAATAATAAGSGLEGELAELAQMVRDNCMGDTGVDGALIEQVDGGAALMADGTLKCYIKCTMEMAGFLSDGEVDVDAVLELLPPAMAARIEPALRGCGTRRGADDCDTAYLTQVCWQNANKADYFLI